MSEERQIEPSRQRRRQRIRERGLPKSAELTTALLLLTVGLLCRLVRPSFDDGPWQAWLADWQHSASVTSVHPGWGVSHLLGRAGVACGGLILAVWLLSLACVVVQGGWTWRSWFAGRTTARRPPWWTHVISGGKLLLLPALLGYCLWGGELWQAGVAPDLAQSIGTAADWFVSSMLVIATGWLVIGVVDYAFRVAAFRRSLRMTPTEWREELKRLEGRPPLRRLQR